MTKDFSIDYGDQFCVLESESMFSGEYINQVVKYRADTNF